MKKIWKTSTADTKFNSYIIKKYGRCLRCGSKENLQCSHFFSGNKSAMRYCEPNCVVLCYKCHYGNLDGWEYHKSCCYRKFMIKHLGKETFDSLDRLAHQSKMTRREGIL